jgi:hypothetical protein
MRRTMACVLVVLLLAMALASSSPASMKSGLRESHLNPRGEVFARMTALAPQ